MRLLENVNETLVSSYFSSQEVVRDKFQVLQANKIILILPSFLY